LNLSEKNNASLDLIKNERRRLQSQNESLTENTKNLTAERDMCSHSECSLGNLITDAMVAALRSDSTWSKNSSTIGIFPTVHLQPNRTIPEGMFTKTGLFYIIDLLQIQLLNL
jgi:2',3'-cyclic-nucleotide 2'-phosphodiesterase (5'-nucleotidase family)